MAIAITVSEDHGSTIINEYREPFHLYGTNNQDAQAHGSCQI